MITDSIITWIALTEEYPKSDYCETTSQVITDINAYETLGIRDHGSAINLCGSKKNKK